MKYKAVIFDLYGTLVDNFSMKLHEAVLREMAQVLEAPAEDFIRLWFESYDWRAIGKIVGPEDNIRYICSKLGIDPGEVRIREAAKLRYEFTRQGLQPWPEAVPVLARLKDMGYKIGLISDCSAETPESWNYSPLSGVFDVTVFSCSVGFKKPDPRIFEQAARELGVSPQQCLYVGDGSSQELTGAAKVGMHPVMIKSSFETSDTHMVHELEWVGPKISSLKEVLELVSGVQNE